jgi:hypothetical protein
MNDLSEKLNIYESLEMVPSLDDCKDLYRLIE